MAESPEYMKKVAGWELTTTAIDANADELVDLMAKKDRLEVITNRFKDRRARHATLRREKQETMEEMRELLREGETLVYALRISIRSFYGLSSEKLVEFGLAPNRPRSRKAPVPPGPEAPAPAEAAAIPDIPSNSEPER